MNSSANISEQKSAHQIKSGSESSFHFVDEPQSKISAESILDNFLNIFIIIHKWRGGRSYNNDQAYSRLECFPCRAAIPAVRSKGSFSSAPSVTS